MMADKYDAPRQAVMGVEGLDDNEAHRMANRAVELARQYLPRVTGASSASLTPIWGMEWFGVEWTHDSLWFQESGIRPFTMWAVAGKVIPMWINDHDGKERQKNPKAKVRTTDDGRTQVLIFRRAAKPGQRKLEWRREGGRMVQRSLPMSYPGAPGRIAVNRSQGVIRAKDVNPRARNPGWIAKGNVGVRWRHPGLNAGQHILRGLMDAADEAHLPVGQVRYLPKGTMSTGAVFDILLVRG